MFLSCRNSLQSLASSSPLLSTMTGACRIWSCHFKNFEFFVLEIMLTWTITRSGRSLGTADIVYERKSDAIKGKISQHLMSSMMNTRTDIWAGAGSLSCLFLPCRQTHKFWPGLIHRFLSNEYFVVTFSLSYRLFLAMKQYDGVPLDGRAMKIEMAAGVAQVSWDAMKGDKNSGNEKPKPDENLTGCRQCSDQGHT